MANITTLIEMADHFDQLGHPDLADRVDGIIEQSVKLRMFVKAEENTDKQQRLLAIVFERIVDFYMNVFPKIDYLKPFWDIVKDALEQARMKIKEAMKDKTEAFSYPDFQKWDQSIIKTRESLEKWTDKELTGTRAVAERFLLLQPIRRLLQTMEKTFEDDQNMQKVYDEIRRICIIFDNIFNQTTAQIADIPFKDVI